MKDKAVCFSLCGNNPLYTLGAIENARLMPQVYPEWLAIFMVDPEIDPLVQSNLENLGAKVVVVYEKYRDRLERIAKCTFWRYYPLAEPDLQYCIFRDCDSRIGPKEARAVSSWVDSGKDFHMIYDHPEHCTEIMGGLWGARNQAVANIKTLIGKYFTKNDPYYRYNRTYDQMFLRYVIYSRLIKGKFSYLAHGDPEICQFHKGKGIEITAFPETDTSMDLEERTCQDFIQNGSTCQRYIGQTILVPYSRRKPIKLLYTRLTKI